MKEKFIPEIGKFVIGFALCDYRNEISFMFRKDAKVKKNKKSTYQVKEIVRVNDFSARSNLREWFLEYKPQQYTSGSGSMFRVTRYATDDDIVGIFKLWNNVRVDEDDPASLEEWLTKVLEEESLLQDEKERLKKIVSIFINKKSDFVEQGAKLFSFFREEQRKHGRKGCLCAECQGDMVNAVKKLAG